MKKSVNKKWIAFVAIIIMAAVIVGVEVFSIVSNVVVKEVLENSMFEFNGIYGGQPAMVHDLIRNIPEYGWLQAYSDMAEMDLVSIPLILFFLFIGDELVDWAEKED